MLTALSQSFGSWRLVLHLLHRRAEGEAKEHVLLTAKSWPSTFGGKKTNHVVSSTGALALMFFFFLFRRESKPARHAQPEGSHSQADLKALGHGWLAGAF